MIVDTSAVIAIILQEENWNALYQRLLAEPELSMSCGTLQELLLVAYRKNILEEVQAFLRELALNYIPVEESHALKALELYQAYGKGGGHPAQLNFGDCFALSTAILLAQPLLYAGRDFEQAGF